MKKNKKHKYKPTATLKGYKEAIQILMVDYADVWEKTGTFKEVDKKLKKLGKPHRMVVLKDGDHRVQLLCEGS